MIYAGRKEDSQNSLIITIGVHAVILLLMFFFMNFPVPDPPPGETYAELTMADFGYSNTGSGDNEGAPTETVTTPAELTPEEAVVDDNSDVSVPVTNTPNTSTQPAQTTPVQTTPVETQTTQTQQTSSQLNDALSGMNSGGDGNDNTGGNTGVENGQIEGKGLMSGDGYSANLAGRGMIGKPSFQGKPTKNGRVVVKIDVNKSGSVINAIVDPVRSNTTEQSLWDLAIKMAKSAKFNNDQKAAIKQRGSITFTFKVN